MPAPEPPHKPAPALHPTDENLAERRGLRDYAIILRERLWLALPLAVLVAVGYAYVKARVPAMYQATATLQFERPERVVTSETVVDSSVRSEIDLNTYQQVLESASLRTRVVESLTPDDIRVLQQPYLKNLPPGVAPPGAGSLVGAPSVNSIRNSLLISVTVNNRSAEGSALLANRYIDQFMLYEIQNIGGKNTYAVDFLQQQAQKLKQDSLAADQALRDYQQRNNLISLDSSTNIITDRLKTINTALTQARLDQLNLQVAFQQVQSYQKSGRDLLDINYVSTHGSVPTLRGQLADLKRQQAVLGERYLSRHPKMIEIANTISAIQAQLVTAIQASIDDLKASLQKSSETVQSLEQAYQDVEKQQIHLNDMAVAFNSLQQQAVAARNSYTDILNRLNQTNTSKNLETLPVRPLDRAVIPGGPYAPNVTQIFRTAAVLGVVVFFGVALGLSFIDDRIKSAWDVESFIGATLLGIIPEIPGRDEEGKSTLVLENKATSNAIESFLGVYSSVKMQSKLDYPKSLLVTSTIPGEGKTIVSCNLAACFARHGKKTLLIDCDLRRPMLHRHFKQPNDAGLIVWLEANEAPPAEPLADPRLGIQSIGNNFWLLRSGGRSKSPTEFLESPAFATLLENLKRHFDLLLIDSPPLGAVTDSLLIAARTDEVLYVCRFNRAARKHIRLYVRTLLSGKNELLGIVLNGLSPRRIQYYSNYRYYRSYKKYYGREA